MSVSRCHKLELNIDFDPNLAPANIRAEVADFLNGFLLPAMEGILESNDYHTSAIRIPKMQLDITEVSYAQWQKTLSYQILQAFKKNIDSENIVDFDKRNDPNEDCEKHGESTDVNRTRKTTGGDHYFLLLVQYLENGYLPMHSMAEVLRGLNESFDIFPSRHWHRLRQVLKKQDALVRFCTIADSKTLRNSVNKIVAKGKDLTYVVKDLLAFSNGLIGVDFYRVFVHFCCSRGEVYSPSQHAMHRYLLMDVVVSLIKKGVMSRWLDNRFGVEDIGSIGDTIHGAGTSRFIGTTIKKDKALQTFFISHKDIRKKWALLLTYTPDVFSGLPQPQKDGYLVTLTCRSDFDLKRKIISEKKIDTIMEISDEVIFRDVIGGGIKQFRNITHRDGSSTGDNKANNGGPDKVNDLTHNRQADTKNRTAHHDLGEMPLQVSGAGAVIFHPFLRELFTGADLLEDGYFVSEAARTIAVKMLSYLTFGEVPNDESLMIMAKTLCEFDWQRAIDNTPLTLKHMEHCDKLFDAILNHWSALKGCSVSWMRDQFIDRKGTLEEVDDGVKLIIDFHAQDVLLKKLPWGVGVIKLPWLKRSIFVNWSA